MKDNDKNFIIEQLDEALEERQSPDRRQNPDQANEISHEDRRKNDRRSTSNSHT